MAKANRVSDENKPLSSARHRFPNASSGATWALIKAWAEKYEQRDRHILKGEDWEEIADAIDSRDHPKDGGSKECKNRLKNMKTKYKIEKAAGSSSWVFFKRLDELLGPASDAEVAWEPASDAEEAWELWELDKAVRKTAGLVAELFQKLRGFEAQMKKLTGMESDELVQALARLEKAWSGFATSVAVAAVSENDSNKSEEDLGSDNRSLNQDEPDGAAGRQTEQPNQTAERRSLKIRISLRPAPESNRLVCTCDPFQRTFN